MESNTKKELSKKDMQRIGIVAGVISLVIIGYYASGLYLNMLQIKKLKK